MRYVSQFRRAQRAETVSNVCEELWHAIEASAASRNGEQCLPRAMKHDCGERSEPRRRAMFATRHIRVEQAIPDRHATRMCRAHPYNHLGNFNLGDCMEHAQGTGRRSPRQNRARARGQTRGTRWASAPKQQKPRYFETPRNIFIASSAQAFLHFCNAKGIVLLSHFFLSSDVSQQLFARSGTLCDELFQSHWSELRKCEPKSRKT